MKSYKMKISTNSRLIRCVCLPHCRLVWLFMPYRSQFKNNLRQTLRTGSHRPREEVFTFWKWSACGSGSRTFWRIF